ncbi:MAG TPA: hypothetical protein VHD36_12800 [Pirellulales bacterium]|nr:hypothetical protein [Pirellulales bacterium]
MPARRPNNCAWFTSSLRLGCALALISLCGCTAARLGSRTVSQAGTLSDLQYQQVLDNLAMFSCSPDSLAWHVRVNGGLVQIADQGQGFIGANLGGPGYVAPNVGAQTNILHQWNVDPVIDPDDLSLLQLAYRKALNPFDPDGSIKHEAYDQICELCSSYHIALTREVASEMLATMKQNANPQRQARLERIEADLHELYVQIDELSETPQKYEPESFSHGIAGPPSKLEFLKEEVVRLTSEAADESVEPIGAYYRPGRNVGLIEQAQDKIEALVKLVQEGDEESPNPYAMPWIMHGCKRDVPKCACRVGHYRGCGCDCYVWITPENMKTFRDFVLIILSLAPAEATEGATTVTGLGAANSPNF